MFPCDKIEERHLHMNRRDSNLSSPSINVPKISSVKLANALGVTSSTTQSSTQEVDVFFFLFLLFILFLLSFAFHCRLNQQDLLYSKCLCVMVSGQQSQSMTQRGKSDSRMERAPRICRKAATMQHTTSSWLTQCYENQAPTTLEFCMTRVNRKEYANANDDPALESVDGKGHV